MDKLWQQKVLQAGGQALLEVLTEMRTEQMQHTEQIADLRADVLRGFPNGDLEGHRRAHESMIRWHELRNQVLRAALEKVVSAGVVAGTGYLIVLFWEWFKLEVKK